MSRLKSIFPINSKFYYIFLTLQLAFYFIKSEECSQCSLNTNDLICKTNGDAVCNDCLSSFETKQCYKKDNVVGANFTYYRINNNTEVIPMDDTGCQNKVIHKTNECMGHCPKDTYELGDFCYLNNELTDNVNIILTSLECKNKYIIEEVSNSKRNKYYCLGPNDKCKSYSGYNFYDDKTNQCIKECINKKIKKNNDDDEDDKRCSDECKSGEFLYTESDISYCSDSQNSQIESNCPYYYTSENKVNICINKCNDGDFVENNQCVSECSSSEKKILVDLSNNKIECIDGTTFDDTLYTLYKYKYGNNYYFKNCTDTQLLTKLKRITYASDYNDGSQSKCVDDCSNEETNKFIFNGEYKCTKCENKFYYGSICYDECPPEHNYIIFRNENNEFT